MSFSALVNCTAGIFLTVNGWVYIWAGLGEPQLPPDPPPPLPQAAHNQCAISVNNHFIYSCIDYDRAHSPPPSNDISRGTRPAWGCEIMSPFIKRVTITQVGLVTNSRLCAFISNAVTLGGVTSSLIWAGRMIDQSMVQWSIPGPELALNRSSHSPCGGLYRVRGERTQFRLSHLFYRYW